MATPLETFRQLRETYGFSAPSGFVETPTPRIKLFWSTAKIDRTPMLPDLGIVIVVSGRKTAYLDGGQIDYDENNYLVVSAPVPFECASNATERDPLLGISVDIDLPALNRFASIPGAVSQDALDLLDEPTVLPLGLQPTPIDAGLSDASHRLIRTLYSPSDTQALGTSLADEIVYRALKGRHGPTLLALTNQSSQHAAHRARDFEDSPERRGAAHRGRPRACGRHERQELPSRLQGGNGPDAPAIRQGRPPELGDGPPPRRHPRRGQGGARGRLRERLAVQPGVQAALLDPAG